MRCLALDVGEKRTGVAVGEMLARPLVTLKRRSKAQDFSAIASLVREHHVDTLVVGLPMNMDGSTGFQAQRVTRYAERMKAALADMGLNVDLVFWDERLTTEQADETMAELGHTLQDRERRIDAVAAAVILQSYLDSQERNQVFDKNPASQA
ncbi:MAG: Holliday junction resolvase RuvX [Anaerolineae bacterium]|nr:Holliday junction resolvase RuvX [Anaerolineae bacterium]